MIPQVPVPEPARQKTGQAVAEKTSESPFLLKPKQLPLEEEKQDEDYFIQKMRERVMAEHGFPKQAGSQAEPAERVAGPAANPLKEAPGKEQNKEESAGLPFPEVIRENKNYHTGAQAVGQAYAVQEAIQAEQLDLFEEKFLKRDIRAEYKLIGQVFETYWLVQFQENLYIIDQHAAHERVLYERTLKEMKNRDYTSQYLSPPIILTLSMQESQLLEEYMDRFLRIGFEIEHFGGKEYAVRAVPANLFGIAKKELLLEMLDSLSDGANTSMTPDLIDERVASLSCKAAVKGNSRLSAREVDTLIGELLLLENPYHCPHGRPTIISMTKRELEKKFKRIV